MDRVWQWAWDRHGPRYRWALCAITYPMSVFIYVVLAVLVVAAEGSDRFVEAAAVVFVAAMVLVYALILPGTGQFSVVERWAAGEDVDVAAALRETYRYGRQVRRVVAVTAAWLAVLLCIVGALAGAPWSRLVQYAIVGAVTGAAVQLIAIRSIMEAVMRPPRVALTAGSPIGDALPRMRPTFSAWSNVSMVATAFAYTTVGAMAMTSFPTVGIHPVLWVAVACVFTMIFAVPISVGTGNSPSLQPIRDLAAGAERVAAGDYGQRLPVVQDDDLGALAASFNRMQAGLAERQRLQAAFGTYVDPGLAARLLEQGDDVFTGERREVTVMFIDIRDFTPFAEANTAEDTVTRLNTLFEIVVPAVVEAGGHVNKFLGDGALAVFGAPNDLVGHADTAVGAATKIARMVTRRFSGELRIGIGINTGVVIAGTIGGGGKLEFTLIGDAVNVAARVEQLTKITGDTILLTKATVDALSNPPVGLVTRGAHALKGKAARAEIFGIEGQ